MDEMERLCGLADRLFAAYRGAWSMEPAHVMVQRLQSCVINEMIWSSRVLMKDDIEFVRRVLPALDYAAFEAGMERLRQR